MSSYYEQHTRGRKPVGKNFYDTFERATGPTGRPQDLSHAVLRLAVQFRRRVEPIFQVRQMAGKATYYAFKAWNVMTKETQQ